MKTNMKLRAFYYVVRMSMILLFIVSVLGIFIEADDSDISRNILIVIQSVVLFILSLGPSFVEKKFKIEIPDFMESIFLLFLICALILGEVVGFFVTVFWWDDMLHIISGFLVAIVGFSIINSANKNPKKPLYITPLLVAVFVFCFSMTIEIIWELIEYTIDSLLLGSNMMRTVDSNTLIPYSGLSAVKDTMHDVILAGISSLIISTLGYFDKKNNWNLFNKWIITPVEELHEDLNAS